MAGVCVQSAQSVGKGYNSSGPSELHSLPACHPAGLWRHDPMLPLKCLIDAKSSSASPSMMSRSVDSVPKEKLPRRKGKKKLLKRRKSIASVSCPVLTPSPPHSLDAAVAASKTSERDKTPTRLPGVCVNSTRIDELSVPSVRGTGTFSNLVSQPHERRKKLPLLAAIKPENEKSEKERFMRASFNYNPHFIYRCPADEESMERFNTPSDRYLHIAIHVMERALNQFGTYEEFEEQTGGRILSRSQIIALVRKYLKKEDLESEIQVNLSEDLLSRGSMTQKKGRPQLNVRVVNLREFWCEGLLRHELGTHYLRSVNNRFQVWGPWRQRRDLCLQHFNPTEEGLASLHSVLFREHPYLWRAALLYYVTFRAAHMSFKDLFMDLARFVHSPDVRWDYCVRAKRGHGDTSLPGSFCKDQVYLDGALQLLKRRRCLDFHLLVRLGKVSHNDIDRLVDHCQLDGTRIPGFMNDLTAYRKQLNHIADCNGLTDSLLVDVE